MSLREDIGAAINRANAEAQSDTPDFILANYLLRCLHAYDTAVCEREQWYGRKLPTTVIESFNGGQQTAEASEGQNQ